MGRRIKDWQDESTARIRRTTASRLWKQVAPPRVICEWGVLIGHFRKCFVPVEGANKETLE